MWRAGFLSRFLQDKREFFHKGRLKPEAKSLSPWAPHSLKPRLKSSEAWERWVTWSNRCLWFSVSHPLWQPLISVQAEFPENAITNEQCPENRGCPSAGSEWLNSASSINLRSGGEMGVNSKRDRNHCISVSAFPAIGTLCTINVCP